MVTNALCIAFSPCGGTDRVIKALTRDLPLPRKDYTLTLPKDRTTALQFTETDLIFLGFPVYGGHVPRHFKELIACLRGNNTPLVMVAVYGNRAYEGAFLEMDIAVRANGFVPIAAVAAIAEHSSAPHIATGRPDADDAEKLAAFGARAVAKAQSGVGAFQAPGAYPTWSLPPGMAIFPSTNPDLCTACGLCVQVCPNNAIPSDTPQETITE